MPPHRDFRSLADRVEIDFHHRPNAQVRRAWRWAAILGGAACVFSLLPLFRGTFAHYAAGPVSHAHRMIENDCASCHQAWSLVDRLNPLSRQSFRSVDNAQCLACHEGAAHHARQIPAHADLSCAECHREHRGQQELAQIGDAQCIRCHAQLDQSGGSERFALEVTRFEAAGRGSHPEFALDRLLNRMAGPESRLAREPESAVLRELWQKNGRSDDRGLRALPDGQLVDRGRLQFNHAVHLKARYEVDATGQQRLVEGLRDERRELVDLSRDCQACHQPDDTGRYMRPINYEQHCARCHPLYADTSGQIIPHGEPNQVRDFLIEFYSRKLFVPPAEPAAPADPFDEAPAVPVSRLPTDELRSVRGDVDRLVAGMPPPLHPLIPEFAEARLRSAGGCRYCHEVSPSDTSPLFDVRPPDLPQRWFLHGEFDHAPHRMVDCDVCHRVWQSGGESAPVSASRLTAEVLIPGIAVCRECHTSRPAVIGGMSGAKIHGAGSHCVECHRYHAPPDPLVNRLSDGTEAPHPPAWKPNAPLRRSTTGN